MSETILPTREELDNFRVAQAVEIETKQEVQEDEAPYFENEMELKGVLLDLKAKLINPYINKSDLVLGNIKTEDRKELIYYVDMCVKFCEFGLDMSARYCADYVLTRLNFGRSDGGFQQLKLITRALARSSSFEMGNQETSKFSQIKNKMFN